MKKNNFWLFICLLLVTAACKKKDTEPLKEVIYTEVFELPAGISAFESSIIEINNIASRRDYWLDFHNITTAQVKSVQVTNVTLTSITSAPFDFASRVILQVRNDAKPSFVEAAFNENIPFNQGADLQLIPNLTELRDYFLGDDFDLQVRILPRNTTNSAMEIRLAMTVRITTE